MDTIDLDSSTEDLRITQDEIQEENFETPLKISSTTTHNTLITDYSNELNNPSRKISNVSERVDHLPLEVNETCKNSISKNTKSSPSNDNLECFQSKDLLCNLDIRVEFTETPETGNNGNAFEPKVFSKGNVLEGEMNDQSYTVLDKSNTNTIYKKKTNNNDNQLIASQKCESRKEVSTRKKRASNLRCNKPVISTYITRHKSKQNMINNKKDLSDHITELQPVDDTYKRIMDSSVTHSGNNQDSSDILEKSSILVQAQHKPLENKNIIVSDIQMPRSDVRMQKKPLKKRCRFTRARNRNRKNKNNKIEKNKLNDHPIFDSDNDLDDVVLSKLKKNIVQEDKTSTHLSTRETVEEKSNLHNFEVQENKIDKIKTASSEEHTLNDGVNYIKNESSLGVDTVHQESECSKITKNVCPNLSHSDSSLLIEKKIETSKRPQRKKAKQRHYELSSDEDPFANVELSDSDTASKRKSKGYRYYSDEEYVPEKERKYLSSDSSIDLEDLSKENFRKKKRHNRKSDIGKRQDKTNKVLDENSMEVHTVKGNGDIDSDIESCLQSSVIKVDSPTKQIMTEKQSLAPNKLDTAHEVTKMTSSATTEFENFLANKKELKIKKVKENKMSIDIPILEQSKIKQMVNAHSQTKIVVTKSMYSQTNSPYDIKLKQNINLSQIQSNHACEFLTSVLESTTELGQLMCEKSSEFLKKKVNINHVQDTTKLDNCVNKAFLLLKLAKENITTMEESLQKQYEQYLVDNNLISAFDIDKKVMPTLPEPSNDSDCEIIEEPIVSNSNRINKQINKLNPKTVFLNKELSIKIAKKTPSNNIHLNQNKNNLLFKGKHPAWISESVTVKKESFNGFKCGEDMANEFNQLYYFVGASHVNIQDQDIMMHTSSPNSLLTLCTVALHNHMYNNKNFLQSNGKIIQNSSTNNSDEVLVFEQLSNMIFVSNRNKDNIQIKETINNSVENKKADVLSLKQICYKNILLYYFNSSMPSTGSLNIDLVKNQNLDLFHEENSNSEVTTSQTENLNMLLKYNSYAPPENYQILDDKFSYNKANEYFDEMNKLRPTIKNVDFLKHICYEKVLELMDIKHAFTTFESEDKMKRHSKIIEQNINGYKLENYLKSLSLLCLNTIRKCMMNPEIFENQDYNQKQKEENSLITEINALQTFNLITNKEVCNSVNNSTVYFEKQSPGDEKYLFLNNHNIPKLLKDITYRKIVSLLYKNVERECTLKQSDIILEFQQEKIAASKFKVESLIKIALAKICDLIYTSNESSTVRSNNFFLQIHFGGFSSHIMEDLDEMDDNYNFDDLGDGIEHNDYECEYNNDQGLESGHNDVGYHVKTQFVELKPCVTPIIQNICSTKNSIHNVQPCSIQIKSEPENDYESPQQNEIETSVSLKLEEMIEEDDEVSDTVVPKRELFDNCIEHGIVDSVAILENDVCQHELDSFEKFVTTVKPFSQSELRIRRQFEPDSDDENDNNMSLLIPHNSQPKAVQTAKKDLMETDSSDEEKKVEPKKNENNIIKGKKRKSKRNLDTRQSSKEETICKEKPMDKEVQILTRRMRERLRQEENLKESSDSETDVIKKLNIKTSKKPGKQKDSSESETDVIQKLNVKTSKNKLPENSVNDIQCSNVDSTQNILEYDKKSNDKVDEFSGFSAVDQNMTSTYKKYVQCVYEKILPQINSEINDLQAKEIELEKNSDKRPHSPLLMSNGPVEMLKCEPSFLMFDDLNEDGSTSIQEDTIMMINDENAEIKALPEPSHYVLKDGWYCYPLIGDDTKLYQNCSIILDKLPEIFVETYFKYTKLKDDEDNEDDAEINRLVDLQSLHRTNAIKDEKIKPDNIRAKLNKVDDINKKIISSGPLQCNSVHFDNLTELSPSEDETDITSKSLPAPISTEVVQNDLAKDLLMNDSDADENIDDINNSVLEENTSKRDEDIEQQMKADSIKENECKIEQIQIKTEDNVKGHNVDDDKIDVENDKKHKIQGSYKKGSKIKSNTLEIKTEGSLVLTADRTLLKELDLLHAPVMLNDDQSILKESPSKNEKGLYKRKKIRDKANKSGDSSSEEEKMWENTKEKLFKKMEKKIQESNSVDDAKRAKLVKEFLERHTDKTPTTKMRGRGGRRSKKKFLEEQKQLRVLTNELYKEAFNIDDTSNSTLITGKKQSYGYGKGRKNIRKVLDKKSLAKSTLLANKEEFDRKRRLLMNQNRLQELLGLEESVKAVVINNELCLQYDFDELQPLVSVHPFFTKVMKAHQCEGVKFMWDACFETVELVEAGHSGGGCILAHCMGLGKTLQVLALLHTVMSHPRVSMQRVLVVCPLSTVLNWVDEINKWLGPVDNQIKVFELSKLKKIYERAYQLEDWFKRGGILIIGYELFRSLTTLDPFLDGVKPTIIQKIRIALLDPGPDVVICDEGHLLKNDCSVLAVAMSRVLTKRRIILTGTPMQNNLREYYCMVNFVKPNLLGKYSEYCNRFENPIINGQHRDSSDEDIKLMMARTHILHKVLEGCLQRQEVSVLYPYLPKKHEYTVFIALTKCQADLYKHYLQHFVKKSKQSILKDFHILQKIWSHPQVLHNLLNRQRDEAARAIKEERIEDDLAREDLTASEDVKPDPTEIWWLQYLEEGKLLDSLESSNKFVTVFKIIDECVQLDDKLLIFSTSLYTMDSLEFFLKKIKKWSLGTEYYRLDGSVPPEVRQKWCREFNADNNHKTKLFLISTRAGSLGLNMTAANRVIILDTSWNPAHDIQSIFRVYRFGQKKDCYIYRLVAMGTMEQKMYERSVTKQAVACRVVDELQIDRHYNMTELTELYSFDELGECVAGGVALGVRDIALLRVARDMPALHAVHEHDSLLRQTADMQLPEHERAAAWDQFQQEQAHKQMQTELLEKSQFTLKRPMEVIQNQAITPETIGMQVELNDSSKKDLIYKSKDNKEAFYDPDLDSYLYPDNDPYTLKTEPEEDKKDPEYFPPDAKRRRGKKIIEPVIVTAGNSSVKSKETPTKNKEIPTKSNATSVLPGNDMESNDLVKGISDIFNEHKLSAQPSEINVIAKNVSRILNQRYSIPTEQIAKKIAELFKEYHKESDDTHPKVIHDKDLMHIAVTESKDSPSNEKSENLNQSTTDRDKQQIHKQPLKLKIQIPKSTFQLASTSENSCDSNKQEESTDIELRIPKIKLRKLPSFDKETFKIDKVSEPIKKSTKKCEKRIDGPKKVRTKVISTVRTAETNIASVPSSDTIVLSDDDELLSINKSIKKTTTLPTSPSMIPTTKIIMTTATTTIATITTATTTTATITSTTTNATTTTAIVTNDMEDSQNENYETVPLHPEILKNQNFIKLVARVYEKGNRMLDEDAALRAAEYSTSRAYDEVIKGTKLLTDGPLHQIAVELIGKQTMKILWNSIGKKHSTELNNIPPISFNFATVPESARTESPKMFSTSTAIQPLQPIPVGIMKSGDNGLENQNCSRPFGLSSEECIIPDDDICITSSLPTTVTTPTPTTSLANQQKKTEPNEMLKSLLTTTTSNINFGIVTESNIVNNVEKKTFILRRLDDKPVGNIIKLTPIMSKKNIRKVFKKQSLTKAKSSTPSAVNTVNPSNTIETTICLDSDEEITLSQPILQIPNIVESEPSIVPQPPNTQSQLNTFSQNSTNTQCQRNTVSQAPSTAPLKPSIVSQNLNVIPSQPVTQITSTTKVPITNPIKPNNVLQTPNILNFSQIKHSSNSNISPLITLVPSTNVEKSQTKQSIVLKGTEIPAQNIFVIQNAENIIGSESTKNVQQFLLPSNVLNSSNVVLPQNTNAVLPQNTNVPNLVPISNSANINVLHINEPSPSTRVDASFAHSPVECIEEFITPDIIVPTTNVITPTVSASKAKSATKTSTSVEKPNPKTIASEKLSPNLSTNKQAVNKTAKSMNENDSQKRNNVTESNDELNTNTNKQVTNNLRDSSTHKSTNENRYDSLFKNIVRIEADVYEKDILENIKQKNQTVSKSVVSSKETESSIGSKVSVTTPTNNKSIDLKKATNTVNTKPASTKLSNISTSLSNKKLEMKKSTNSVSLTSKVKPIDAKTSNISSTKSGFTKQKVTDIVDLTDIEYGPDQQKMNTKCVLSKNQSKSKDAKRESKIKSKTNSNLLDTVDLTDLDEVILSGNKKQSTQKSKEKKGGKVGSSLFKKDNDDATKREAIASVLQKKASEAKQISKNTISGTSKTIILNKDKVLVKTDPKPSTSSIANNEESTPKVLHIKKIYSSTSSNSNKRKNHTGDDLLTFKNKKQKTSQFKSLEDFSFEDFEDIIELE